ncbi:HAD ATPase, P-type, IC family protein [Candidatus Phytoplasma oryzae]|uniref:Cation-transporting ATPase n=1 Tax=Candidatus Phytoplasma oryzae TaxID=203274 RepID=A0A139JQ00_9MOLU|nr:HAD-IC family P-type ATPase [Candidatus Phytoplasma oryzae]KXT29047.1 HAD ATPase, P-type, IC family protein [Candidatus Phytoplasma oryzae]RAM57807.1 cation-transporting ATPase [Candidatus Phytoplasma oryzae]
MVDKNFNNSSLSDVKEEENIFFSEIKGLDEDEIIKKKKEKKDNYQIKSVNKNLKDIIFSNLFNFLNLLVLIITIIICMTKRYEQLFFLLINCINISISIFQEIRAKKALDKISLLILKNTKVIRNNKIISIPINDILLEDILFLEIGSQIVADAKLKKGILEVNESLLTGESKTVFKKKGDLLYSGSFVISGNACAEVISVGTNTYISKLTQEAKKYKKIKTPLTKIFSSLTFYIIFLLVPTAFILFLSSQKIYILQKNQFFLGLCGFMLGMLPSGLFLLTSITLAIGFVKLAHKNAYIKDLFGIEMLARVNVLCLDKTGTITDGSMLVKKVISFKDSNLFSKELISELISAFPNNNPTQNALYKKFVFKKEKKYKIKKVQYFSSSKKYSAVEIENFGTFLLGSPEFILKNKIKEIEQHIEENASLGYRVLLLAQTDKKISQISNSKNNIDYKIISLIIIEDQIKSDIIKSIDYFQKNNVKIKIISGDNPLTIGYIANRIGIIKNNKKVVDLFNVKNEEIDNISLKYDVFGRSSPEQKKRIINNLKKKNYKVAMIGDGVNDILAFKEADISIAMSSGSEAAQNVANLVLIDSQFSSLPDVVLEGRRVINNLNKISVLFFTKTILSFFIGIITILNNLLTFRYVIYPFSPLQMNLIDTFFIGIPSFFLALEPNTKEIDKNFLTKIFKDSLPYSILIAFNYFLLLFFTNNSKDVYLSFFLTLITSFCFLIILIKNCIPFNKFKFFLVFLMFLGFIISSYFLFMRKILQKENLIDFLYLNYKKFLFLLFINIIFWFLKFFKWRKINFKNFFNFFKKINKKE